MAETTGIEWCDSTFNPVVGCTKVSAACDNCYAETWAKRTGQSALWNGERRLTSDANWRKVVRWQEGAGEFREQAGHRRRVFCASLADVFDNQWKEEWREALWVLIQRCPGLDFLMLTKRPQNIRKMLPEDWGSGWPNVWLGTTVENQEEADRRIPHLLAVPARVHFLSCEPLLGPIRLHEINLGNGRVMDALRGETWWWGAERVRALSYRYDLERGLRHVKWAIGGGESGPNARPWHLNWARSLRDQCASAGVPFFWKQHGEWLPGGDWYETHPVSLPCRVWNGTAWTDDGAVGGEIMVRLGKARAGALLDGVAHRGMPA